MKNLFLVIIYTTIILFWLNSCATQRDAVFTLYNDTGFWKEVDSVFAHGTDSKIVITRKHRMLIYDSMGFAHIRIGGNPTEMDELREASDEAATQADIQLHEMGRRGK